LHPPAAKSLPARKAKVLQLLVGYTVGGVEKQLLGILPWVKRWGYEISVCALKGQGPLTREFRAMGIPTLWLGGKGKWDPRVVGRLYLELRRSRPAILHCYTTLANWAGALAGRAARVPVVVLSDRDVRTWLRYWQRWVDKCALSLGTCMTMPSEAVKRFDMERLGYPAQRLVVVPNGVDVTGNAACRERQDVPLRNGAGRGCPQRIGYVGRIVEPLKGVGVLLSALRMLRQDGIEFEAILVGDGRDRGPMELLSKRLGLGDSVIFLGERKDAVSLMGSFKLLVVPSLLEGSPNVVLEAMASGVPVLATASGGTLEIVKHGVTGWLVPPGDASALAKAMAWLLKEPEAANQLALQARAWVARNRSMEAAASAMARLYDTLLAEINGSIHAGEGDRPVGRQGAAW